MNTFNPTSDHPSRAVQAWQILVSKAMNRQTVTYEILSELMYRKKAQGVLAAVLGHVAFYCKDNNMPPLTAVVVGKWPGKPGQGLPADPGKIDKERERVYRFDWYNVRPPAEVDLSSSYRAHHQ